VKKKSKIDQYLPTMWTKLCGLLFVGHPISPSVCRPHEWWGVSYMSLLQQLTTQVS